MSEFAKFLTKDNLTKDEIFQIETILNNKTYSHDDLKYIFIASQPANFNPFNFLAKEDIFYVMERLILKGDEYAEEVFKNFCKINLKLSNSNNNKIDHFEISLSSFGKLHISTFTTEFRRKTNIIEQNIIIE